MTTVFRIFVLLAALLSGAVCHAASPTGAASVGASTAASAAHATLPLPPPSALETRLGIQVVHVGLTASGGLVDVRFKVLDAAKVKALLDNPANVPTLIAGDKPPLMAPHHALRGARYSRNQIFFILYPNLRRAVQPGGELMVALGSARLGPLTAQ